MTCNHVVPDEDTAREHKTRVYFYQKRCKITGDILFDTEPATAFFKTSNEVKLTDNNNETHLRWNHLPVHGHTAMLHVMSAYIHMYLYTQFTVSNTARCLLHVKCVVII